VNGWMGEWMDEWMNEWMDGGSYSPFIIALLCFANPAGGIFALRATVGMLARSAMHGVRGGMVTV
jgi:hypothetical protein